MGIWFLLNILIFSTSGGWLIYHSRFMAGPSLWVGLYLVIAAAGLLLRIRLARAMALAAMTLVLFAPVEPLASQQFPEWAKLLGSLNIMNLVIPQASGHVLIMGLVAFVLAWQSLRMLLSKECDTTFGLSRPPIFTAIISLLVLGMGMLFDKSAPSYVRQAWSMISLGKEQISHQASPESAKSELETQKANEGFKVCHFSLDESRLLLVNDRGAVYAVDLRTGKTQKYPQKVSTQLFEQEQRIGPDADTYFNSDSGTLSRFSDSKFKFAMGNGGNRFISYTSTPDQIVVYNMASRSFRRIDIPLGRVLWESPASGVQAGYLNRSYSSPEFTWVVLPVSKNEVDLVNLRSGVVSNITSKIKADNHDWNRVEFGLGGKWLRVENASGDVFAQSMISLSQGDFSTAAEPVETILMIPDRKLYLSKSALKDFDGRLLGAPFNTLLAKRLEPEHLVFVVEKGKGRASLLDLEQKRLVPVGTEFGSPFDGDHTCLATSSTGRLVALAHDGQVEVFWSGFLESKQIRSLRLSLKEKEEELSSSSSSSSSRSR